MVTPEPVLKAESAVKNSGIKALAYLRAVPPWGWKLCGLIVLLGVIYLAWCRYWPKHELKPGQVATAQTPANIANMPTMALRPQQIIVYRDKVRVVEKLGLSQQETVNPHEQVQAAIEIPKMRYGGKAAVFIDMSSGKNRTVIKANEAPWFSFEKGNILGVAAGASSRDGIIYKTYYQRDFAQVKGVYVSGRVEAFIRPDARDNRVEGVGMVHGEYRW